MLTNVTQAKKKTIEKDIAKFRADIRNIEDELKETEFDADENPATYTTDELTVTRSIRDLILCMKLHQNFCENHNQNL